VRVHAPVQSRAAPILPRRSYTLRVSAHQPLPQPHAGELHCLPLPLIDAEMRIVEQVYEGGKYWAVIAFCSEVKIIWYTVLAQLPAWGVDGFCNVLPRIRLPDHFPQPSSPTLCLRVTVPGQAAVHRVPDAQRPLCNGNGAVFEGRHRSPRRGLGCSDHDHGPDSQSAVTLPPHLLPYVPVAAVTSYHDNMHVRVTNPVERQGLHSRPSPAPTTASLHCLWSVADPTDFF